MSIWQWIKHGKHLDDSGELVTPELFNRLLDEEMNTVRNEVGEERFNRGRYPEAAKMMSELTTSPAMVSFLTLPGYDKLD